MQLIQTSLSFLDILCFFLHVLVWEMAAFFFFVNKNERVGICVISSSKQADKTFFFLYLISLGFPWECISNRCYSPHDESEVTLANH